MTAQVSSWAVKMSGEAFVTPTVTGLYSSFISSDCLIGSRSNRRQSSVQSPCQRRVSLRTQLIRAQASIADTILRALENEFKDQDIARVSKSFRSIMEGTALEVDAGTSRHQRAASFVQGLEAVPFYDDLEEQFKWVRHLENNWEVIARELRYVTGQDDIEEKGNNIWVPPVVEAANAYGPDWRTLVLQDRQWDSVNSKLFPQTIKMLQDKEANIPSVEAFFARQLAGTGIKLHTDDCNFILTMHLALSAPENQSWIEVAGERRYWKNGKGLVFNTSYYHRTMNESKDQDREVLLIRFWHPQLAEVERRALSFLFQVIDQPDTHPAVLKASRQLRTESQVSGGRKNGLSPRRRSGGRGFGQ